MMKPHFAMFAAYNGWANDRLYAAARAVSHEDYLAEHGAFFGSLNATLNHLLVTDRIWMHRFSGDGPQHSALNEVLTHDLDALAALRTTEDARHAVAEHHVMDKMLADLAARDMGTLGWKRRFARLREEYLHHIREEEQEQFLAAQQHLRPTDVRHMRQVFEGRKRVEKRDAHVRKKIRLKD